MNIEVSGLYFSFPGNIPALNNINLSISGGEKVAIIGQNGSGKTTLVRHFNGLLKPSQGSVMIGDWETSVKPISSLAGRVGYVFQNPDEQLFCSSVQEELGFGPRNLGFSQRRTVELVEEALSLTGLHEKKNANPYDLSPAWRKMVTLASVLAMDTPIIILDEPNTGQDAVGTGLMIDAINTASSRGKTVIAITHDLDFCAENFQRVIALSEGKILADGDVHSVMGLTSLLAQTCVEPPQLTRLGMRLGLQKTICSQDDFFSAYP